MNRPKANTRARTNKQLNVPLFKKTFGQRGIRKMQTTKCRLQNADYMKNMAL
jgi:hypothetical protein